MHHKFSFSTITPFCMAILLTGCSAATRLPLNTVVPPVETTREGPDRKILGYMDTDGTYRRLSGSVRAIGPDSIQFQGTSSTSTLDRTGPGLPRPSEAFLVPRTSVGSLVIRKGKPLRTWALTLVIVGGLITIVALNTENAGWGM